MLSITIHYVNRIMLTCKLDYVNQHNVVTVILVNYISAYPMSDKYYGGQKYFQNYANLTNDFFHVFRISIANNFNLCYTYHVLFYTGDSTWMD